MQDLMQKIRRFKAIPMRELIRNGLIANFSGDYRRSIWQIAQNIMNMLSATLG